MNIYEALTAVMRDCGAVGKDSKNPQQGYKYRGIDAVMNAVNPALTKNRVFVAPEVLEMTREERTTGRGTLLIYSVAKVKYTFYAEDGSSITAVVIGEGMDSGDKSMNKAMSAAFKYALFQVLCIPTEEMIDSEVDSPEPQPKSVVRRQAAQAPQQTAPQATPTAAPQQMSLEVMAEQPQNADMIGDKAAKPLEAMLIKKGVNIEKLLEMKGVKSLAELSTKQYGDIIRGLNKAEGKAS